jgi:predicted kinase
MWPRLLVVSGPPCTGKSTIAMALRREIGGVCLEVDSIRQQLIPESTQSLRDRNLAYSALHLMTAHLIEAHVTPIILVGTYTRPESRIQLTSTVSSTPVDMLVVQCRVEPDTAVMRFENRSSDHAAVDLTAQSVRHANSAYPFTANATVLDTSGDVGTIVRELQDCLAQHKTTRLDRWCSAAEAR